MTRKLIITALLLITIVPCLRAQKKEISQAREYIKSGENLDQAASLMEGLINKDTLNRKNPKIYLTWFDAVEKQYEAGNQKLYLKQAFDTTLLYQYTKTMFDIVCQLDSIVMGDDKIKADRKKRGKYAETLDRYRRNLYVGGVHHLRHDDFKQAFIYFDTYIASASKPLFAQYDYNANDRRMTDAAFWATCCANRMGDPHLAFRYGKRAEEVADTTKKLLVMRWEAEAALQSGDTLQYVGHLRRGFRMDPRYKFNFPRLMDYYTDHHRPDSALRLADDALRVAPNDPLFLYAKSTLLLNMGRNDECIQVTSRLIALCDTMALPYFNIGTAVLNKIVTLEEDPMADKEEIRQYYKEALPYMRRFRQMEPREQDKWAPALYRIYFNLNMGSEFEEIDRLINAGNKKP